MRYLTYIAGGFLLSCLLFSYVPGEYGLPALGLTLFFGGIIFFLLRKKKRKGLKLLTVSVLLGLLFCEGFFCGVLKPIRPLEGKTLPAVLKVLQDSGSPQTGNRTECLLKTGGRNYRVLAFLKEPVQAGDTVRGSFRFRIPGDHQRYRMGQGIFLQLSQKGEAEIRKPERLPIWALPGSLRSCCENMLSLCLSEKAAPFGKALFLGETVDLSYGTDFDLSVSGIRHLAAVSGLHVSMLFLAVGLLTLGNRRLSAILGIPVLFLFAAVTGFSPSVVRACIMMTVFLLAGLLNRRYDPLSALSAALILMLLLNPMTVISVSFQMSFASLYGILMFYKHIRFYLVLHFRTYGDFREKLKNFLIDTTALSLASTVLVGPLSLLYFGRISLIAPLTNALVLWLVPAVFVGLLLLPLAGSLSMPLALFLGKLLSEGISYILTVSHGLAGFPLSALYGSGPFTVLFLLFTFFLGVWLLRSSPEILLFVRLTAFSLSMALLLNWFVPLLRQTRMTVFDVGQGQCILLQTRGRNFLVDCGGDSEKNVADQVVNTLLGQGVRKLDGMVLTHFDRDHVGAADEILEVLRCSRVFVPNREGLPKDHRIYPVTGETVLSMGNSRLTLFGSETSEVSNEMSLCVLLESPKYDILITGDRSETGEHLLLKNHRIPRVDCLIAGHHGAADSTSQELLQAVEPETVIISAGRGNSYGHPAPETLKRLQKFGCQVLRTDRDGTIRR